MRPVLTLVQAPEIKHDFQSLRRELETRGHFNYSLSCSAGEMFRSIALLTLSFLMFDLDFNFFGAIALIVGLIDANWWIRGFMASIRHRREASPMSSPFITSVFENTQNITENGEGWNWFTGGHGYQIEHRLFPDMPSRNYPRIAREVKTFATCHDLPYREASTHDVFESINQLLKTLV